MVKKYTTCLIEEYKSSINTGFNSKLPFYCMKILNHLEKESTMFNDSINYISKIIEQYMYCLEEAILQKLS